MKGITLSKLFGDCPNVKILECFADNYKEDLSVEDIVYISGVPRTTVYRKIKKLVENGILKKTRRYGKTQLYTLNIENEISKTLVYLETLIAQKELEKRMKREGIEIPIGKMITQEGKIFTIDFYEKDSVNTNFFDIEEEQEETIKV